MHLSPSDSGLEKQETYKQEADKGQRKALTSEMSAEWPCNYGVDLGPGARSVLCEETERG
jgi:hypothetical protein